MDELYDIYNLGEPVEAYRQKERRRKVLLVSAILVVLVFMRFSLRCVENWGRSMEPTYSDGYKMLVWRPFYHPQNGDVVIVNNHCGYVFSNGRVVESGICLNEYIVKRVIAVEGQTINIDAENGTVYVDGILLNEPYIKEPTKTNDRAFDYPITIPEGYVFIMGDNRNHSTDSRSAAVGLVNVKDIYGVVIN